MLSKRRRLSATRRSAGRIDTLVLFGYDKWQTKTTFIRGFDMTRTIPNELALLVDEIKQHKVIVANPYTNWFAKSTIHERDVENLLIQFSVFSNHFLRIQCTRMVNAVRLGVDAEREARAILVSELGVTQDSTFAHYYAHINWLRETADPLELAPPKIPYPLGDWELGLDTTHRFLEELEETYGSRDPSIAAGASFAIETWAGFGLKDKGTEHLNFWKQLIVGLNFFNKTRWSKLKLNFFEFHVEDEKKHVESVERELLETFDLTEFNIERWKEGAFRALDAILMFWEGLDEQRKTAP